MRILHVLEPTSAGVPRLVTQVAEQQTSRGDTVQFLAPATFDPPAGTTRSAWSIDRRRPWSFARASLQVRRVARDFTPDVVHAHSFFAGLVTRLPWVSVAPAALVYQPHAWAFDILGGRVRRLVQGWERYAARRTTALVTNCTDELDRGRAAGIQTPGWAIGIAVDVEHLQPPTDAERTECRRRLGLGLQRLALVLGRIAAQKGQDQLVRHWAGDPLPGTRLVLVGAGDPAPLQRAAGRSWGEAIAHAGATTYIRDWLWAADVLLIPSRYETVSLVAGEAMATGLPVVATDFDGVAELLGVQSPDPAGLVVPLGDMTALLRAARELLADGPRHERLGRAGRERAVRYCSPQNVERALREVYVAITPQSEVP